MAVSISSTSAGNIAALYASQGDRVSSALRRPAEAVSRETEGTRVRLSAFGQIQSAAAGVQAAARNLQDAKQVGTVADAKQAAETFVKAFNNERATLARVTDAGGSGKAAGALADDGRARVATSQLERTLSENAGAFRDAGIRVQKDGSLSVDAGALEAAYSANPAAVTQALGSVGRAAETTATRQLSSTGSVGAAVNNLSNRVQQLETRQADYQSRADASQRMVDAAAQRYGFGASGASAYQGIFKL